MLGYSNIIILENPLSIVYRRNRKGIKNMKTKLIIFDVDGVMIDSERIWCESFEKAARELHLEHDGKELFLNIVGKSGDDARNGLAVYLKDKTDTYRDLAHEIGFASLRQNVPVKPGLYELLETIDQLGFQKAIATSTRNYLTEERLTKIKVFDRFDYILCGNEVQHKKPNPEIYLKVLEHFQIQPEEALVFEDSYYGVEAAYNAHIPCIMIPDLLPATSKQEEQTICIVKDLYEVIDYLKRG